MGHGLDGERLEEAYRQAQEEGETKRRGQGKKPTEYREEGHKLPELPPGVRQPVSESGAPVAEETASGSAGPESVAEEESRDQKSNEQLSEADPLPEIPAVSGQNESAGRWSGKKQKSRGVGEALDWLQRAKERLQIAEEKTGQKVRRETPAGGLISRLLGRTKTETVVERTEAEETLLEKCRKEVQEARRALRRALEAEGESGG